MKRIGQNLISGAGLALLAILLVTISFAQNKEDGKIKIRIETETEEGKNVFEKSYSSKEEMKNDPELQEFQESFSGDVSLFEWSDPGSSRIKLKRGHGGHEFEDFDLDLHLDIDEDALTSIHLDKELEELELDLKLLQEDLKEDLKHLKDNIYFQLDENFSSIYLGDDYSDEMEIIIKKRRSANNVNISEAEKGDPDLKDFDLKSLKHLELKSLAYYPNPSNGKFSLKFNTDKKSPVQVKVLDILGTEVYSETVNDFSGSYDNEIDLRKQERGVYLLQIIQNERVVRKKVLVE